MVSAFSIPKAQRNSKSPKGPGPGDYNPENSQRSYHRKNPCYSFDRREGVSDKSTPGPGDYQVKPFLVQTNSPSYSIKHPIKPNRTHFNFGPAYYQPNLKYYLKQCPAYSIRTKLIVRQQSIPGPGDYEMPELQTKGYHIGKQSKFYEPKKKVPGPGSYHAQDISIKCKTIYDPKYTFRQKCQEKYQNTPGPGQYSPGYQTFTKMGGLIHKDVKTFNYTSKYQQFKKNTRNQKFGFDKNDTSRSSTMFYDKMITKERGESLQMIKNEALKNLFEAMNKGNNHKNQKQSIVCGDSQLKAHHLSILETISAQNGKEAFKQKRQARLRNYSTINPGPGAYDHSPSIKSVSVIMGKEQKLKPIKSVSPGPGHYQLKPTFADVPNYLLPHQ